MRGQKTIRFPPDHFSLTCMPGSRSAAQKDWHPCSGRPNCARTAYRTSKNIAPRNNCQLLMAINNTGFSVPSLKLAYSASGNEMSIAIAIPEFFQLQDQRCIKYCNSLVRDELVSRAAPFDLLVRTPTSKMSHEMVICLRGYKVRKYYQIRTRQLCDLKGIWVHIFI